MRPLLALLLCLPAAALGLSAPAPPFRLPKLPCTLAGHTEGVTAVAFQPRGRTVASASWDRTVKLWDLSSGRNTATLPGHADYVIDVAFSPDRPPGERAAYPSRPVSRRVLSPKAFRSTPIRSSSDR
jgi:WD40 repeat protein